MTTDCDPETEEYVIHDPLLGDFYGATPRQAHDNYIVALRVATDHARKNPPEAHA